MAQRLISAVGKGVSKTIKAGAANIASRAAQDVPSTQSFYKLGMGIGPFIRNTVNSYQSNSSNPQTNSNSTNSNANVGFAKENVIVQKNIAGQLSALTSIMSDIRKISLAQLNLQRASLSRRMGDQTEYLSRENILERITPKSSLSGTQEQSKGALGSIGSFFMNNPGISAGLLGILALANAKDIQKFMQDTGLNDKIKEGTKAALDGLVNIITTTLKEAILTGIPAIFKSVTADIAAAIRKFSANDVKGGIESTTNVAATGLGAAGAVYGFRKGKGFLGKTAGAAFGFGAGYFGTKALGETATDAMVPGQNVSVDQQSSAQQTLGALGAAGIGYGAYKAYQSSRATPMVPPAAAGSPPPTATAGINAPGSKSLIILPESTSARTAAQQAAMEKAATGKIGIRDKANVKISNALDLVRRLVNKMGASRVAAFVLARLGLAVAGGAIGFTAGPIGFITSLLGLGIGIYTIMDVLEELDKEIQEEGNTSNGAGPTTPAQSPAGTLPNNSAPVASAANDGGAGQDAKGNLSNPVPAATGSKGRFGENRGDHLHTGVDISAPEGAPVLAVDGGKVVEVGNNAGYGNYVVVEHSNGMRSKYGHLSVVDVKKDTMLKKGQQLGKVGSTGKSEGPHLHLDIINPNGEFLNPRDYVQGIPAYSGKDSGRNPEGSLAMITGRGNQNMSGDSISAPSASLASTFSSAFGFDPSKMGVDFNKVFSGDQIAKLNALQNDIKSGTNTLADLNLGKSSQQPSNGPSNPGAQPAPQRKADNARTREKDFLYNYVEPQAMIVAA